MKHIGVIIIYILLSHCYVIAEDNLIVKNATKEVTLSGYTRTIKSQSVSAEISGKVLAVHYDIGDRIGEKPFIEIDPTFVDFQIKRTSESLERIEITIKKAHSRVSYFEKESQRISKLHKEDMATESKRDSVLQDLDQARLEIESALKEQSVLKTQLSELKERRSRHRIWAPKGWIVTDRNVEENENVQPGSPLARVSDYRKLVVPLYVSNEELSAITSLPHEFDAKLEGAPVKVSVNWINPEFDEKTRKLNIELIISNYEGTKRGGLKLSLPVHVKTEGFYVPKSAVSMRYENPTITLKHTGEVIQLLVLGDAGDYLLVAEDERLTPGIELIPVNTGHQSGDK